MSHTGPWSVKGIDQRARDAAREAAHGEGMTLGEYINRLILKDKANETPNFGGDTFETTSKSSVRDTSAQTPIRERLDQRIEAIDARSTLAITGIDQSLRGIVARLDNSEHNQNLFGAHIDGLVDEIRAAQEALQRKVAELESDDGPKKNLDALKALEHALGQLASHVYDENQKAKEERAFLRNELTVTNTRIDTMATKVEDELTTATERLERVIDDKELRSEGTARHLAERLSTLEAGTSATAQSLDAGLKDIQARLAAAESSTHKTLETLETTISTLESRFDALTQRTGVKVAGLTSESPETRIDEVSQDLRAAIKLARTEFSMRIDEVARMRDNTDIAQLETSIADLKLHIEDVERRSEDIAEATLARLSADIETRLSDIESHTTSPSEHISLEIGRLSDELDQKIIKSEQRSAKAIEQIGDQVAGVAQKLQTRQDDAMGMVTTKLDQSADQVDMRITDALGHLAEGMDEMRRHTSDALSPLQRAIVSLAERVESMEDFTTPPFVASPIRATPDLAPSPSDMANLAGPSPGSPPPEDAQPARVDIPPPFDLPNIAEDSTETWTDTPLTQAPHLETEIEGTSHIRAMPVEDIHSSDLDPLASLVDWDEESDADGHAEVRDSDVFDDVDDFMDPPPHGAGPDSEDDIFPHPFIATENADPGETDDTLIHGLTEDGPSAFDPGAFDDEDQGVPTAEHAEDGDTATTRDYISRAREAAQLATSSPKSRIGSPRTAGAPDRTTRVAVGASLGAILLLGTGFAAYLWQSRRDVPYPVAAPPRPLAEVPVTASISNLDAETENLQTSNTLGQPEALSADASSAVSANLRPSQGLGVSLDRAENPARPAPTVSTLSAAPSPSRTEASTDVRQNTPPPPIIPVDLTLEQAAENGDRVANFLLGSERLQAQDITIGVELIQRAARDGLPIAQYRLAKLHEAGLGVPRDLALAETWTERAARGGNIKAMHDLAVFLTEADGDARSFVRAAEWFRKAAEFGLIDSQYNLAQMFDQGLGVSPDPVEALFWMEIAAANGDREAANAVETLRSRISLEAAQQVQRRAASWQPATPIIDANAISGDKAWSRTPPGQSRAVQSVLNALGYDAGPADGALGARSRAAIRAFQEDAGLTVSGTVDSALITALNTAAAPLRSRSAAR